MPSSAIECTELSKSYGHVHALRNLTLTVARGSSLGLLGENGWPNTGLPNVT